MKQKKKASPTPLRLAQLALAVAVLALPLALRAETPAPFKPRLSISISTDDVSTFKDLLTQMKSDSEKAGAHIQKVLLFTDQIDKVALSQGIDLSSVQQSALEVFNSRPTDHFPPETLISIDSNKIPTTPEVADLITSPKKADRTDYLNQYVKNVQDAGTLVSLVTTHSSINQSPKTATPITHSLHHATGPGTTAGAGHGQTPGAKGNTSPGTGPAGTGPSGKPVSNGPVSRGGSTGGSSLGGSHGSSSSFSSGPASDGSGEKSGASSSAGTSSSASHSEPHSSSNGSSSGGGGNASGGSSFSLPGGGGGGSTFSVRRGNYSSPEAASTANTGEGVGHKSTASGDSHAGTIADSGKSPAKPAATKQKPAKKKKPAPKPKSGVHRYREFSDFK